MIVTSLTQVHAAQANLPFPPLQDICYFEIKILNAGKKGTIGIGLADGLYALDRQPGWAQESYGYHGDDGRKYWYANDALQPTMAKFGPLFGTGDIIGCGMNNISHEIFFTKNGKLIGSAFRRVFGTFFPTVGLHSPSERITARFSPPFTYPLYLNSAKPELINYYPRVIDYGRVASSVVLHDDLCAEFIGPAEDTNGCFQSDQPFNPAAGEGYYEVEILSHGKKGYFAVGLAFATHRLEVHPGWIKGSWAYHGDDGRKFGEDGAGETYGPTYTKGDIIGCGYSYITKEIYFTKNGVYLGVAFSNIPEGQLMYPTVGLHSIGEKVRVSFSPPFKYEPNKPKSQYVPFRDVEYTSWTAEQVGQWLTDVCQLPQYTACFNDNDITGEILPTLSVEVLKVELGISSFGHRMQIIKEIAKLSSEQTAKATPPTTPGSARRDEALREVDSPLEDRTLCIKYDDLKIGEFLGKGFFGEVRRAQWRSTDVAVKVIYRKEFRASDEMSLFEKEIKILSILRHPCIVQFMGICLGKQQCIVTEYLAGGNLENLVRDKFHVLQDNPQVRVKIITNIAKGMCYLHEWDPPILHRDLTPRNILLDKNFNAKVADFGLSRLRVEDKMTVAVGYLPFQAPEVFKGEEYSEKADVYSFGLLVWFLFAGKHPDEGIASPLKMANMVAHENYRPRVPDSMTEFWKFLVCSCWDQQPEARPTFTQLTASMQRFRQETRGFGEDEYLWDLVPAARRIRDITQQTPPNPQQQQDASEVGPYLEVLRFSRDGGYESGELVNSLTLSSEEEVISVLEKEKEKREKPALTADGRIDWERLMAPARRQSPYITGQNFQGAESGGVAAAQKSGEKEEEETVILQNFREVMRAEAGRGRGWRRPQPDANGYTDDYAN